MAASEASAGTSGDQAAGPEALARQICLQMLTAAPRTRAQLAAALRRCGVPAAAAEAVLGRFAEAGLIDDATFARAWVESRHHSRGLASRVLAAELVRRGVAPGDVQAAIEVLAPGQEAATARALVARRLEGTRGLPLQARTRRLIGVLARKGYPQALAYRVVREALEQEGIDPAAVGIGLENPPEEDPGEDALGIGLP
jgi:regulatory protein